MTDAPTHTGPVAPVPTWRMLTTDHGDQVQSLRVRAGGDWDPGAYKAACPDGLRLIGLSHTAGRGLCTDTGGGDLRAEGNARTVVTDERHVPQGGDWASGYTKFQCPSGQFLIGYSRRGGRVSAALCAPARIALGGTGRTVWFDRSDNRPADADGGDYATATTRASAPTTSTPPGSPSPHVWAARRAPRPYCAARCPEQGAGRRRPAARSAGHHPVPYRGPAGARTARRVRRARAVPGGTCPGTAAGRVTCGGATDDQSRERLPGPGTPSPRPPRWPGLDRARPARAGTADAPRAAAAVRSGRAGRRRPGWKPPTRGAIVEQAQADPP